MEAINGLQADAMPAPAKTSIERLFTEAYPLSRLSGLVEARLTLDKLWVRFLEIQGDLDDARTTAEKLFPEADAMGFIAIAEEAREVLENRTLLMRYEQDIAKSDLLHRDQLQATQTDAQLSRLTQQILKIIGSPPAHPKTPGLHAPAPIHRPREIRLVSAPSTSGEPRSDDRSRHRL